MPAVTERVREGDEGAGATLDGGYVLWLGGIFAERVVLDRPGVNPAAWRWQKELVGALARRGLRLVTLGHAPEPLWPRGRLRDAGTDPLEPGVRGEVVGYWNLPAVRMPSLRRSYLRGFERIRARHGDPALVVSYNAYPYNIAVGRRAQRLGVPWVPIVADVPRPGRPRERHDRAVGTAAGRVFLSWGEYRDPDHAEPKLHLDGGIRRPGFAPDADPTPDGDPVVVYTGSLGKWGGVMLLLEAFRRVRHPTAELWICGHGATSSFERAVAEDPRVRFLGLVPEQRLREVCERATVFVNPRPAALPSNAANFPSKVLEYLKHGKPVVSTWTKGLAPAYRRVLAVAEEQTPECLAATIEQVLAWDAGRRREVAAEIRAFLEAEKLWDAQARRLAGWLDDVAAANGVALARAPA